MTNRVLLAGLIKREIVGRYRGSVMGLLWSFFNPVLMLAVYTFVFSVVFKARWASSSESKTEFAMVLFSGLMAFNLFAENINRSPSLILGNANYVKKVIFPLEILPVVVLGSAGFHFLVSLLVWLIFHLIFLGVPSATVFLLPLTLMPLALLSLGLGWFLASLGVFLRDIGQIVVVLTMVLMYLTPIFYPISALPDEYQGWMNLNPLTESIEQIRNVMMWGAGLDWLAWMKQMALGLVVAWLGFAWFQKTRKGFADVV
ncbi:ABC transporter permease [Ottowia sp. VDI28]|uniref:ABC transporter permease n=1 Tax=unclassified Ottowia TaxID=2645081 RepID=UPI003C2B5BBC